MAVSLNVLKEQAAAEADKMYQSDSSRIVDAYKQFKVLETQFSSDNKGSLASPGAMQQYQKAIEQNIQAVINIVSAKKAELDAEINKLFD